MVAVITIPNENPSKWFNNNAKKYPIIRENIALKKTNDKNFYKIKRILFIYILMWCLIKIIIILNLVYIITFCTTFWTK